MPSSGQEFGHLTAEIPEGQSLIVSGDTWEGVGALAPEAKVETSLFLPFVFHVLIATHLTRPLSPFAGCLERLHQS